MKEIGKEIEDDLEKLAYDFTNQYYEWNDYLDPNGDFLNDKTQIDFDFPTSQLVISTLYDFLNQIKQINNPKA